MDRVAIRGLVHNRQLRRLMAAWAAFYTGELAHFALLVVFTYSVGGAAAVGAATLLNVLPGGLFGPLAAVLATSPRARLHLASGICARSVLMVGTMIAVLSTAPLGVVMALVAVDSLASAAVRPLHGALIVRLADTVAEAAAANAATSSLVNVGALVGPALAGLAFRLVGIGWAFALPALASLAGTAAALLIREPGAGHRPQLGDVKSNRAAARSYLNGMRIGFRAIVASRPAAAATAMFVLNMTLVGVWDVASAPIANGRLGLGQGGVTTIMTLAGVGGVLGALATLSIVGLRGLAGTLAGAMVGMAVALAAIGTTSSPAPGLALAAGVGVASAAGYAVAPTLVQRSIARSAIVAASASLHSLYLIGIAAGAVIAPLLIGWAGVSTALAGAGATAVLATLVAWPHLRRADTLSPTPPPTSP